MSKDPKERPWQEEVAEIFRKTFQEMKTELLKDRPSSDSAKVVDHKTAEELAACPNCHKTFNFDAYEQKIRAQGQAELAKAIKERNANRDLALECDECGTKVGESEKECPTCHGHAAHRRE